jgi:serine/threonine protein kinase
MAYVEGTIEAGEVLRERYQIREVIGKGAYGVVYLADDLSHNGVKWAIKEIWEGHLSDEERDEAISRFRQEVSILKGLNHTGIPKIIDSFSMGPSHFIVMEYIEGKTAEELCNENTPDEKTVVSWALKICDILDYLHHLEPDPLIYRDIKPGNIMITAKGRVLLIDFGIARFFNPTKQRDTMILGTPGFAPPEQYGRAQSDMRSDIYALGATMYHLLTDKDLGIFNFRIPPVRELRNDISPELETILIRCLAPSPEKRYADVSELGSSLKNRDFLLPPAPQASPIAPLSSSPSVPAPSAPPSLTSSAAAFTGMQQTQNMVRIFTNVTCAGSVLFFIVLFVATLMSFHQSSSSPDIWTAVKRNSVRDVDAHLRKNRALVNERDEYGKTPIFYALQWGFPDMAKHLLKRGADVNLPCTADHQSPLFVASDYGWADTVELLLKKGALVEERNKYGYTPLMIASARGNTAIVQILLDRGACINAQCTPGTTSLVLALDAERWNIAELLIRRGADINLANNRGMTPLASARLKMQSPQVEFLQSHGAR